MEESALNYLGVLQASFANGTLLLLRGPFLQANFAAEARAVGAHYWIGAFLIANETFDEVDHASEGEALGIRDLVVGREDL